MLRIFNMKFNKKSPNITPRTQSHNLKNLKTSAMKLRQNVGKLNVAEEYAKSTPYASS